MWREGLGSLASSDDNGSNQVIAHTLRGEGFDASEDGTGRGTPLVPVAVDYTNGLLSSEVFGTLEAAQSKGNRGQGVMAFSCKDYGADAGDVSPTLRSMGHADSHANGGGQVAVAFNWQSGGDCRMNPQEERTDALHAGQTPAVLLPFDTTQITSKLNRSNPRAGDPCHPLAAGAHAPAIAFTQRGREGGRSVELQEELAYSLTADGQGGGRSHSRNVCTPQMAVRRLTPRECERLQGFPDDYTLIPGGWRLRKQQDFRETVEYLTAAGYSVEEAMRLAFTPDGPRYHALGNSWAVPVARWIGERIDAVDAILGAEDAHRTAA